MNKEVSSIPKFADAHYSVAHDNVFNIENRLRVARQILAILQNYFRQKNLSSVRCLDVGSSSGIITEYLSHHFKTTEGVDIDPFAVRIASQKHPGENLHYQVGSAMHIPFEENSFDVVTLNETLTYVDDQEKTLDEVYRVLKPQGVCFITADNALFPIESQYNLPFIHWIPERLAQFIVNLSGHKNYYLGNLKTYWQLTRSFRRFVVHDYTLKVLKYPRRFQYVRLYKYQPFIRHMPLSILRIAKFFVPTFVFLLEKPHGNISERPRIRTPRRLS